MERYPYLCCLDNCDNYSCGQCFSCMACRCAQHMWRYDGKDYCYDCKPDNAMPVSFLNICHVSHSEPMSKKKDG